MILSRVRVFLAGSLILLAAGLFGTAYWLNARQYAASSASQALAFQDELNRQSEELRKQVAAQEAAAFGCFRTGRELEQQLFIVDGVRVVPACTEALLQTVSAQEAESAFAKGLAAQSADEARRFFETAAQRDVKTPEDLYRKISALFNLLDQEPSPRVACCILTLLDGSDVSLSAPQKRFFYSLLEEAIPDIRTVEQRLSNLWKTAKQIDPTLVRQKGGFRGTWNGKMLLVNNDGLALLYSPDLHPAPPVMLTHEQPPDPCYEVVPGLWASLSPDAVWSAQARIRNQYRLGNAILALLLLLGGGLLTGVFAIFRRQQELSAMKTEFVSTVSHELRTPLSLIRLYAETLCYRRIPDDKTDRYLKTILTESERLSGMINNVLDFSRMERQQLRIHLESVNLSDLCRHILESFDFRLEQDGFQVDLDIAPNLFALVDSGAFTQVVFNLIDNAIKYSAEEKRITVDLTCRNGEIILRVADRGIGIPDPFKKRIFEDFSRADDPRVGARRGSGIGLSVARRLVREMGGRIGVADNAPSGSVFTVSLREFHETAGC